MGIRVHPHATERMLERGATEEEIRATISQGERVPAKFGRVGFRRNFPFNGIWQERPCNTKQVEAYAVQEGGDWLIITVITRYF